MQINRIQFGSSECETDLCRIAGRYGSDRSPLNDYADGGLRYRHAYTPVYEFLFSRIRDDSLTIAEIGILDGAGLKTFREYFSNADLYGFDSNDANIAACEAHGLPRTTIGRIDVRKRESVRDAFHATGRLFDLIIDDSTHRVDDQVRLMQECSRFLKRGGYLVIEDIFDDDRAPESRYAEVAEKEYRFATFVQPQDERIQIADWNNEKMLVLVR